MVYLRLFGISYLFQYPYFLHYKKYKGKNGNKHKYKVPLIHSQVPHNQAPENAEVIHHI